MPRSKTPDPGKPKKAAKKPIEQYQHQDKRRVNNPPVGLVRPENDPEAGRKSYAFDPHLDPQLVWAGKAKHTSLEVLIEKPDVACNSQMQPIERK